MIALKHSGSLGVPLAKPRVALSAASPRTDYRAVGFPLQSLTRLTLPQVAFLLAASLSLAGCDRSKPFEKTGWQMKYDGDYPNRNAMVQDLLDNHALTGGTTNGIIDLLGKEDHVMLVEKSKDDNQMYMTYQVLIDFGWNIDPVHTRYLVLDFDKDSVVTKTELVEWKQQ